MNTKVPKAELSSSTSQNDIKPEPPSDDSDNEEEGIYKNLTEEQLLRARKYNECFICQKRCTSFSNFRSHVFQHANANKFKCEKCFNEFAQLKYLKAHLTTHNENRVFTCDMCKQNFASKSSIRGHMRVHTGMLLGPFRSWCVVSSENIKIPFVLYRREAVQMQLLRSSFQRIVNASQALVDPFAVGKEGIVSVWNLWQSHQNSVLLQRAHGNPYWCKECRMSDLQ